MADRQTVKALRIEAERLWQVAIEARRAAAAKEREYRAALGKMLDELIAGCSEVINQGGKDR